jgi:hypothetical protein
LKTAHAAAAATARPATMTSEYDTVSVAVTGRVGILGRKGE